MLDKVIDVIDIEKVEGGLLLLLCPFTILFIRLYLVDKISRKVFQPWL